MAQTRIPLMRPLLPPADKVLPYLQQIDANRWYSNSGPLAQAFQARLAETFGIPEGSVVLAANGTLALQLALGATALKGRGTCLMPAWTFAATPLAAMQAGLKPHFADIDPATRALSPDAVLQRHDLDTIAAIMPVAPFGRPPDIATWNAVQDQTGIPVVIDAAAGFDGLTTGVTATAAMPIMVSLHATKPLGVGEGGLIITHDVDLGRELARLRNFGFDGAPASHSVGTNAKLSEYHAAVGLAALDAWPQRRSALTTAHAHYARRLASIDAITPMPGSADGWTSSTLNIITAHPAEEVIARLAAADIESRSWWGPGCHTHPAFAHLPCDPLPHTDILAPQVIGLPLSPDITESEIDRVCAVLAG